MNMTRWFCQPCFANRMSDLKDFELTSFSGGQTLLGIHLGQLEKNGNMETLWQCGNDVLFSMRILFIFVVASWSFIDPHKGQNRLKGSVNDLVGKVALWNSILSFLLPGTWQHTKWFGSLSVPRIWKIQIAVPLWEKAHHPVPRYVHQIPPSHQWVGMRWGPWNFHIWCIAQVIQVIKTFPNFTLDKVFLDVW